MLCNEKEFVFSISQDRSFKIQFYPETKKAFHNMRGAAMIIFDSIFESLEKGPQDLNDII